MSRIDQLIAELCPNGVRYLKIADICEISRGRVISKDFIRDNPGDFPVYSSQTENDGVLGYISEYDYEGDYLTWTTDGAHAGTVFHRKGKFCVTNVCGLLKVSNPQVSTRFLFFVLSITAKQFVNSGMGNPKLMSNVMARIPVPIPPLPVQEEIVRILDSFTKLEDELEDELEARKKQYEHYRDTLLGLDKPTGCKQIDQLIAELCPKGVEYRPLGVLCTPLKKGTLTQGQLLPEGKYPVMNSGRTFYGKFDQFNNDANAIVVASRGEYAGFVSYIDQSFWAGGLCYPYRSKDEKIALTKFVYYALKNHERFIMDTLVARGSIPALNKQDIDKLQLPLPPLSVQDEIVRILDRFDKLCNDISEGLPAEIEARRKQYEYYRDKLLTFDESKKV